MDRRFRAVLLSLLVPGLGQLYNGERAKGIAVLCMTIGIVVGVTMATTGPAQARSSITVVMLGLIYVFVWIPAVIDAYQRASGQTQSLLSGTKTWYVILMLLSIGPMALPLLWQSPRFSRPAKIIWTVIVILLALLAVVCVVLVGPTMQRLLDNFRSGTLPY